MSQMCSNPRLKWAARGVGLHNFRLGSVPVTVTRSFGSDASLAIAGEAGLTLTMERQTVRRAARHCDHRLIAARAERISLLRNDRPD
jgi:hypothetical protein